jgi:hypothetical protein
VSDWPLVPIDHIDCAPTARGFLKGIIVGGVFGLIIWALIISLALQAI